MKTSVRIGITTLTVTQVDKDQRTCFDRMVDFCESHLPGCGCDVVLLPEQFESRPEDRQPVNGSVGRTFGALAREHKLFLVAPLAERQGKKWFNAQAVFAPSGRCIHVFRKVHLAPSETKLHTPGAGFRTFDLPWFRAGILTCFDNQFPESSRVLALLGAQVLFWPSYGDLAKPHRAAARCLDNHIYLVSSGIIDKTCKLPAKAFQYGMALDPDGNVFAATGARDGLAVAELPLRKGKLLPSLNRESIGFTVNYLKLRRPQAYKVLTAK